jgi:predicted transport protein
MIGMVQHKTTSDESISTISDDKTNVVNQVSKEVKVYTEDDHFNQPKISETTKQVYLNLKEKIMNIGDDINIVPKKVYIGYKRKTNFIDISIGKNELWCWINMKKGELDDPKGLCRDITLIGHYGNGDFDLKINEKTDLDYVIFLINQSYKKQD